MFSFDAIAYLAFGAITAVAIRAAKDSFISYDEDCWHSQHIAPDTLDTLTDVITKALGQQCRSEMQGLMKNLVEECAKIEGHSERDCISDLFTWLTGQSSTTHFAAQLAKPPQEAMLWAGFYDGDPRGLTHKALQNFSSMVDTSIVHPSTILGQVVQKNNDLHGCRGDPGALRRCFKDIQAGNPFWDRGPVLNFWVGASQAFVRGMASQKQASVVAVVNKELDPNEEWSLKESVFWSAELQTLGAEISTTRVSDFRPQILLVDMRGTCTELAETVTKMLEKQDDPRARNALLLREKPLICIDCVKGQCDLDQALAARVRSCLQDGWVSSLRNWLDPSECPRFPYSLGKREWQHYAQRGQWSDDAERDLSFH